MIIAKYRIVHNYRKGYYNYYSIEKREPFYLLFCWKHKIIVNTYEEAEDIVNSKLQESKNKSISKVVKLFR